MVARNISRYGFDLLHPQVSWTGSWSGSVRPSYFSGEFSVQSVLAAVCYRLLGESDTTPRLITIGFSLLGVYFLYDLIKAHAGARAATLSAFIYALLPYHIFFGRVFMPDVPAISLALGGLDLLDKWSRNQKLHLLLVASVLTSVAVLQKLTVVFVGLPMLYLFRLKDGSRFLLRREPYVFFAIVGVPVSVWYLHAFHLGQQSGFFIMQPFIFGRYLQLWFNYQFIYGIFKALVVEALSPIGTCLLLAGLLLPAKSRADWLCRLWLAGAALVLALTPLVLPENHYYLSLLLPGAAGVSGLALNRLRHVRRGRLLAVSVLVLFAADAIRAVLPLFRADRSPRDLGIVLSRLTAPQDRLVTESGGSPIVLYFADRRGWMLNRNYNTSVLDSLKRQGARYYADAFLPDSQEHQDYFQVLNTCCERLTAEGSPWTWPVYDLRDPLNSSTLLAAGEIQHPCSVNFGNRIELIGTSVREVLSWPTSFEIKYYWRSLNALPLNLRVFVHFTDSNGVIVAQQDHWPLGGRLPTSAWTAGSIIRERYIVVLPGSVPVGKYKIQVGWFEPVRGARVRIVNSTVLNRESRAEIAEIEVHPHRGERWFGGD
jgi:hypothetical protein